MSTFTEIAKVIEAIAPTVANAILPGSGTALSMLSEALTGKSTASPDQILTAATDPDAAVKIKQCEMEYKEKVIEMKAEVEQSRITGQLDDQESARDREIELAKLGVKNNTQNYLAYINMVGFFAILASVFFVHIQEGMKEVAFILIGSLSANCTAIFQYYFGSSIGVK